MQPDMSTRELYDRFVIPTYSRFDLRLARGKGSEVWDDSGKRYLDFGAGIAVTSIGLCHPRVISTMQQQIATLVHTSNLYFTRPQGELAQRLVRLATAPGAPSGKAFFCNSGAEANEALYKLARKFGNEGIPGGRNGIVTMLGSFHGRTLAGISATGQDKVKKGFDPLMPGFQHVPFKAADGGRKPVETPGTNAILLQPVQGEIGGNPANPEFLRLARQLCNDRDLLLMFDEVQC